LKYKSKSILADEKTFLNKATWTTQMLLECKLRNLSGYGKKGSLYDIAYILNGCLPITSHMIIVTETGTPG